MTTITLDKWDIIDALQNHLKKQGIELSDDLIEASEFLVKVNREPTLDSFKEEYGMKDGKMQVIKEFDVDGLYVKRKNKKTGKVTYVKKTHYYKWQEINPHLDDDWGQIEIGIDPYNLLK